MEEAEERIIKLKERHSDCQDCVKVCPATDVDGLTLNLASLDLSTVPVSLCDASILTQLDSLYLDYNDLTELPCEMSFEHLTKLSLIGNRLTSLPLSMGELENLQELYLNENELVSLPDTITQQKLFPQTSEKLQLLRKLYADENELKQLPKTFGRLRSLEILELGTNRLVQLPKNFGWLERLQVLNLSSNKLDSLPESFAELCSLTEMDLSGNNLRLLPSTLNSHRTLRKLFLDKNTLDELPQWIGDLPELMELSLLDNKLKGAPLPEMLGTICSQLTVLDLGGNFISHLPDTLGKLKHLEKIHLGSVIDELERRNFQNGNWLWSLPENFGQNRICELPASFSQLRRLRVCVLSKNHLELLPSDFGELRNLEDLRLDNNKIAELPESFVQLTELKTLDLFNNRLTDVPDCLQSLPKLIRLDLDKQPSLANFRGKTSRNDFGLDMLKVPQRMVQSMYAPRDPALKDNWRGRGREDLCNVEVTQNDFGLDVLKVPQRMVQSMYAPRDPALKDNWRGRGREDLCNVEVTQGDSEGVEEEVHYNYNALKNAVSRNMALWKSHDGPKDREVFVHPVQSKFSQINYSDEDSEASDSESGSAATASPREEEEGEENEENWDLELEPVPQICSYVAPAPCMSTDTLPTTCMPEQDVFVPSEQHVTSMQRQPVPCCVTDGQFDDADDDDDMDSNR
ncbi:hypothetical protein NP493_458g04035 [Ridgeia piscesae]|uniref:Uncharacterized protein n=1 Tax=Ridgeia piscesae TaxID=27915 RepID=A0AAD9L076_RIDPI|nr:hypothetical protein NP493_458g04035 [Ridgeia piscesae]